jgi:glycosyltransferase involved in cell wall biosynthesis
MTGSAEKKLLLMDKVLLSPHPGAARGVEVFNLFLIRELSEMGCRLTVPCHKEWVETIRNDGVDVETIECSMTGKPIVTGLIAAAKLMRRRFDVLHLGNVANGLIPAVKWLFLAGVVKRCVVMSHREPSRRFVHALKGLRCTVLAVNGVIAGHYRDAGYDDVHVYFGLPDTDQYFPAEKKNGDKFNFCIVGYLDNAWKGADTAIEAFRKVPADIRRSMNLHLVSYKNPPTFEEDDIIPYKWMSLDKIPELLREMDVMIVPSRDEVVMRETFCLAAVQGMLTGLPLLVNDLPILVEKVEDDENRISGIVFDSPEGLAASMVSVFKDKGQRDDMSKAAREIALERYAWSTDDFYHRFLFKEGSES